MIRYISHPEVRIDPDVPVPQWGLSEVGVARARAMLAQPWVAEVGRVLSSGETKAMETARILADHLGLDVEVRPSTHENDRSGTGFVPPDEFELLADAFFASPDQSVRGWERAVDAQARVAAALADLLVAPFDSDVAVCGHGGVGTLWYCHVAGLPIDRAHDQRGGGHFFTVDPEAQRPRRVAHPWHPIDDLTKPAAR